MILSDNLSSSFTFPLFLKKPIRLSCGFPRFDEVAAVKASNHKTSFLDGCGRVVELQSLPHPRKRWFA
jgi:hypothetical protein